MMIMAECFFVFIFFLLSNPIYTFSRQSLFRWSSECVVIPIRFSVTLLYFILFKRALHNAMVQYLSMSMTFADLRTLPMHDHSILPGFTFSLCSVFGTELTTHVCLSDICNNRRLLETLANRMRSKSSNESWGGPLGQMIWLPNDRLSASFNCSVHSMDHVPGKQIEWQFSCAITSSSLRWRS